MLLDVAELYGCSISRAIATAEAAIAESATSGARARSAARSRSTASSTKAGAAAPSAPSGNIFAARSAGIWISTLEPNGPNTLTTRAPAA